MKEMWVKVNGYPKYEISNTGKVKSLNYNNTGKPQELKIKINKYGFAEVSLSKNNKKKDFMLARLVAEHFVPNPKNCPVVTNIDNDKTNCSADNLKWVYISESRYLMYKKGNRKVGIPSEYKISYNGKAYKSYSDMAKDYGLTAHQLFKRLDRGWDLDLALNVPVDENNKGGKPLLYEYYDEYLSVYQISEITGIDARRINKRLGRGWNIYEAAEIPKRRVLRRKK